MPIYRYEIILNWTENASHFIGLIYKDSCYKMADDKKKNQTSYVVGKTKKFCEIKIVFKFGFLENCMVWNTHLKWQNE